MIKKIFLFFSFVLIGFNSYGATIYVDINNTSGTEDGSESYPFNTIQEGVDYVISADTVLVSAGHYYETIDFGGKNVIVKSKSGAEDTIIDGTLDDHVAAVLFYSDETQDAVLEGFTIYDENDAIFLAGSSPKIINNMITGSGQYGIHCYSYSFAYITGNTISEHSSAISCQSYSSVIITNNLIIDNEMWGISIDSSSSADIRGNKIVGSKEGISCGSPSSIIDSNNIYSNETAIACSDGSPTISNNIISGNHAYGIISSSASPLITNNIISGNKASGIYCHGGSSADIISNTIAGNGGEGGIYFSGTSLFLTNNIITSNGAPGVYLVSSSSSDISYNDVWNNGEDTNGDNMGDENYTGYASAGEGDISVDPLFEGKEVFVPREYPTIQEGINASNTFRLAQGSPCIGKASDGKNMGGYPEQQDYNPYAPAIVYVSSGNYTENILLPLSVQLIGESADSTILDGADVYEYLIIQEAVYVIGNNERGGCIKGFTIRGGSMVGIYCFNFPSFPSFTIADNIITENNDSMAALYCIYASPLITNNLIIRNDATAIFCIKSSPIITNNTILKNSGSGIYCSDFSSPIITNNILNNNGYYGINAYKSTTEPSYPVSSYNDLWNNTYGAYGGDAKQGVGDFFEDPFFVDVEGNNFHLYTDSPCIDQGNNSASGLPDVDFEGDERIVDGNSDGYKIVDIGADEYTINNAPEIHLPKDYENSVINISAGQELKFIITANDADKDDITLTTNELPQGVEFVAANRINIKNPTVIVEKIDLTPDKIKNIAGNKAVFAAFSWMPNETQVSVDAYEIIFTASDVRLQDRAVVYIKVN